MLFVTGWPREFPPVASRAKWRHPYSMIYISHKGKDDLEQGLNLDVFTIQFVAANQIAVFSRLNWSTL